MRYINIIFIMLFTFSAALYAQINTTTFTTVGKDVDSIVVKDLSKNKTIYAKDDNKPLRPASLTKIMTCMLAIESGKMDKVVTITKPMIDVEPTKLGLKVGDKVKLKDLVHAALIKSANDSACAIAYYLGNNDEAKFISMMNKKAKKLGMKSTNFENPCGFDDKKHKSTARDLMKLAEYAIKNKTFNSIVKLNYYTFRTLNTNKKFAVYTSNKLQRQNKNVVGLKTGYTSGAGACLIARAKKDNKDILFVMLNANNRWNNAKRVLDVTMKSTKKTIKKAA
ncbi:MAG: serine hydrolase [Sulfurimonas sp.]|nr:serine hydrolase [Sulfurimonas sp.]MDD3060365.1 serine hydrolase [Sulfurimonas sp.]MDD5201712.1 serine hydrolase [Sulfurimonas sp.]